MANDADITPLIILRHMQAMEERIMQRFEQVDKRFLEVDEKFNGVHGRFDRLEAKVDSVKGYLLMQIDNMDKRLDDIEVVQLPAIKKVVGIA